MCLTSLSSTTQTKTKKMAVVLERSRSLADVIDREQGLVDDAQSTLLVDLAKIVADSTAKEAEATAAVRRDWWTEARESLLNIFSLAHNSSQQSSRGVRISPCNELNGNALSDTDLGASAAEKTPPSAAAPLLLVLRTRLNELLRAEEARVANIATDAVAAADAVGGRGGDRGGPLHLAVAEKQRCSSEAIKRCADAIEALRSEPSAWGGENKRTDPVANQNSTEGGSSSSTGRHSGTHNPEEEFESFRFGLEAETVQLAAASFGAEVGQLATSPSAPAQCTATEVVEIGKEGLSSSPSSLPSDDCPPSDLTRSQLDLRRAARVRAFARALGEMMSRWREALLDDNIQASLPNCGRH